MIIMEAILSASALLHGRAAQSVGRSVVRTFKRWRAAYTAWHRERRAMAELLSTSDRDLRDIGIDRCEILRAVRGDTARSVYDAMPISFAISRPSERRITSAMTEIPRIVVPDFPLPLGELEPLRAAAEQKGSRDFTPLWSGQAAALSREMPAAMLMQITVKETLERLHRLRCN